MKKEFKAILVSLLLALAFSGLMSFSETVPSIIPEIKQYLLVLLLLLIQTQILNGIQDRFINSNNSLIDAKRELFLFYIETKDHFHSLYNKVIKINQYYTVGFLLAHTGFNKCDDKSYAMGKKWLEKQEQIPFPDLSEKINLRTKYRLKNAIRRFHIISARYKDIFFECLSGQIIKDAQTQSIIEFILVWVSYFYFLAEVFSINLSSHAELIIIFFTLSIVDVGKHYISYKNKVEYAIETYTQFYDQLYNMHQYINAEDCLHINIEGEPIPYTRMSGCHKDLQI